MTPPLPRPAGQAGPADLLAAAAPPLTVVAAGRHRRPRRRWWAGTLALTAVAASIGLLLSRGSSALLVASFPQAKRLITNERAYFSPWTPGVRKSRMWEVTSGSLYSDHGDGWTGVPDGVAPNLTSSNGTDSAVFRVVTRRTDFTDVTVSFDLRVAELVTTKRTPATAYDGVHVFLRYRNDRHLYVVSVFRRDGIVAVKEKVPGGPSNGGTYYSLAETRHRLQLHQWVPISVTIVTLSDHAVRISARIGSLVVLNATERGSRVAAILAPGRVGLRGDNCEFYFRDFTVSGA